MREDLQKHDEVLVAAEDMVATVRLHRPTLISGMDLHPVCMACGTGHLWPCGKLLVAASRLEVDMAGLAEHRVYVEQREKQRPLCPSHPEGQWLAPEPPPRDEPDTPIELGPSRAAEVNTRTLRRPW